MECIVVNSKKVKMNVEKCVHFTARELAIVNLIADGSEYKEIAHRLGITSKTVQWHLQQVSKKTDCHNKFEIVKFAREHNLLIKEEHSLDKNTFMNFTHDHKNIFLVFSLFINVIIFVMIFLMTLKK